MTGPAPATQPDSPATPSAPAPAPTPTADLPVLTSDDDIAAVIAALPAADSGQAEHAPKAHPASQPTPPAPETPAAEAPAETPAPAPDLEPEVAEFLDQDGEASEPAPSEADTPAEDPDQPPAPALLTVRVNGEDQQVTVEEAVAGYQRHEDYSRKTMELADDRKAFEGGTATVRQDLSHRLEVVNALVANMVTALNEGEQAPDKAHFDQLLQDDPAAYTQLKAKWDDRYANIRSILDNYQHLTKQQKAEAGTTWQKFVVEQDRLLALALPAAYGTPEKATAAKATLNGYLESAGFSKEELPGLVDHRQVGIARKAMLWDQLQAASADTRKQVLKAPKKVPPGKAPAANAAATERINAKRQTLARNPNSTDALAAIFAEMP